MIGLLRHTKLDNASLLLYRVLPKGGQMPQRHPKREFLEAAGALHAHPARVRAALFEGHRFFDPLDKVQVKYEMLRAHAVDGDTVKAVSKVFGFSRQTFYTTLVAFDELGIIGLTDEKRGRRTRLKLSE